MEGGTEFKEIDFNYVEELAGLGYWQYNFDDGQSHFSDNLCRMMDCEPGLTSDECFLDVVHPDDRDKVSCTLRGIKSFEKQLPCEMTYRISLNEKPEKIFKSVFKEISDDSCHIVLGVTSNITSYEQEGREFRELNRELQFANSDLESFNYAASHDLQEPLRKVLMYISRVEEGGYIMPRGKDFINKAALAARRMQLLINDLLFYSYPDHDYKFAQINLEVPLKEALQEVSLQAEAKNALIIHGAMPVIPVISFQMRQLFINLISNALKYSQPHINPVINISAEEVSGSQIEDKRAVAETAYYCIKVTDNGIGFRQEHAEKLFALFHRLHKKDKYDGTGIGLAICKKITDNHKGFISAKGKQGKGAEFCVYLPV